MNQIQEDFHKLVKQFVKDHDIRIFDKELINTIKDEFEYLNIFYNFDNKKIISNDQSNSKLIEFHKSIMQEFIDFINKNEDIKKLISKNQEILKDKLIYPDVRVYFGADHLDSSLEENKWTPGTDSSLSVFVGPVSILNSI